MVALSEDRVGELFEVASRNKDHLHYLDINRFLGSEEDCSRFISRHKRETEMGRSWRHFLVYKGRVVGMAGLNFVDRKNRIGVVFYWLDAQEQGKGIVTEAVARTIDHSFIGLNLLRVELTAVTTNIKSRNIAERSGMQYEGTLRNYQIFQGISSDVAMYSITRDHFMWKLQHRR